MRRPTILDVARRARVSAGTVSRALNGQRVTTERARRVHQAATHLGYQTHFFARGMRATRTGCVGIVISGSMDVGDPWLQKMVLILIDALSSEGYDAVAEYWDARRAAVPRLLAFVDGCFLLGHFPVSFYGAVEQARGIPLVTCAEQMPYPRGVSLQVDWQDGARQAVGYLLALGHRSIGLVVGGAAYPSFASRIDGFRDAMREFRNPLSDGMQILAESSTLGGVVEARQGTGVLLDRAPQVTAIVYGSDRQALAGIEVLRSHGKRVPEDVSVIGFDDTSIASLTSPSLTTVGVDYRELSRQLLRAFEALRDNRAAVPGLPIKPILFKRETTVPRLAGESTLPEVLPNPQKI
jgi:DNA-binding LacI/PurR family transcriptional regulator